MAKLSYEDASSNSNNTRKIGFFKLKDGEEAIVRIMHDSPEDFDLYTVHNVSMTGDPKDFKSLRKINCIRGPHESIDKCPLCARGDILEQKMFVHLLRYVRRDDGTFEAIPETWEKSAGYANTVRSLISEYGPLSNCIFKIKRTGAGLKTRYEVLYPNPEMYPSALYPKDNSAFLEENILGTKVWDKSFEDLFTFVQTGNFSNSISEEQTRVNPQPSEQFVPQQPSATSGWTDNSGAVPYSPYPVPAVEPVPQQPYPSQAMVPPQAQPVMQRPTRYY